jgi:hypothetical protein
MLSESARMSSAAEARFRLQAPNSRPRRTKVIALDAAAEPVVKRLAEIAWTGATFLIAARAPGGRPGEEGLTDLEGNHRSVADEVNAADLVIMIATAGADAQPASGIGQACSLQRVNTTALVVGTASASDEALSTTLAQLRPWSLMVVMADRDDYIQDMMIALRA